MTFVLRMAARETRASWRRLLFFFVCIAVGVAAIVALRSVIQSVREVFGSEARGLLAADVLIATNREWPADARTTVDRRLAEAGSTERTETIETPTMVRPADRSKAIAKMAELRAVQSGYPLYGSVVLQGADTYAYSLLQHHGTLVRPELLTALGVQVGDQITIGQATRSWLASPVTSEAAKRRVSSKPAEQSHSRISVSIGIAGERGSAGRGWPWGRGCTPIAVDRN